MLNAEKIYRDIIKLPLTEREKLFTLIARRCFEKQDFNHKEVFFDIREAPFTVKEAAFYLEVSPVTVRRWVKNNVLKYKKIGRNLVFDPEELKNFKKNKLLSLQTAEC